MDATFDKMFYGEGTFIGGVDESGTSDIAGPLIAACVVLPRLDVHKDDVRIFEIDDSKKIPEKYRKKHAEVVWETAIAIGIGEVQPAEVDYLGANSASTLAMMRAVLACKTTSKGKHLRPDFLLVDGTQPVRFNLKQAVIEDADQKSLCVAAASIVAKVYRDDIMISLHKRFPWYDWVSNKGHPCEKHFAGLDSHGIQVGIHRIKFWPFIPNPKYPETHVKWAKRRKLWKKMTCMNLEKELVGETWTIEPNFYRRSTSCKTVSQEELKAGLTSRT